MSFTLFNRRLFGKYIGLESESIEAAEAESIASPRAAISSNLGDLRGIVVVSSVLLFWFKLKHA